MSKISKNYRLNETTVKMLDEVSSRSGYSQTDIVQMAVSMLYSKYVDSTCKVPDYTGSELLQHLDCKVYYEKNL